RAPRPCSISAWCRWARCRAGIRDMLDGLEFAAIAAGLLGYLLIKLECELAPFILGFILGPMIEENFRRAMLISGGDAGVFVTRPVSASLLVLAAIILAVIMLPAVTRKRNEVFVEES